MKRLLLLSLALVLIVRPADGQTPAARFVDSARVEIDLAAAAGDTARMQNATILLDRALVAFPNDPYLLHYRGFAYYRRAVWAFHAKRFDRLGTLVTHAIEDLRGSAAKLKWGETYMLIASLNGIRIAMDGSLGQTLGAESAELRQQARSVGPANPRVLLLLARGAYNTPEEYGGGIAVAQGFIRQAVAAFETDRPAPLAPTWGRDEALAFKKEIDG